MAKERTKRTEPLERRTVKLTAAFTPKTAKRITSRCKKMGITYSLYVRLLIAQDLALSLVRVK